MGTTEHRRVEVIGEATCRALLASTDVGRLAVQGGSSPEVFPVNFRFDGDAIYMRSGPGTKLGAARRLPATFEVDAIDGTTRTGWSVVAKGILDEVTPDDEDAWGRAIDAGPEPWADGERRHVLRLRVRQVSGRRLLASRA